LCIFDRGTSGLAGPTRADAANDREPNNFVAFFRNIGREEGPLIGGGTYGYGKASLYMISHAATICVHTRCRYRGRIESRFMASALGKQYTEMSRGKSRRFTGRHWWGRMKDDRVVDPLTGLEADRLAEALGMPPFADEETGTSILIIKPRLPDSGDLRDAVSRMADSVLWYCWPKLTRRPRRGAEMSLSVLCEGQPVDIPSPDRHPLVAHFVSTLNGLDSGAGQSGAIGISEIRCEKPQRTLGRLALQKVFVRNEKSSMQRISDEGDSEESIPNLPLRHVALMRNPRLVVKYLVGEPLPIDTIGYVGVFVADPELNGIFADAEPPTHDEWHPETLEQRSHQTFVRVALRRVKQETRTFVQPSGDASATGSDMPLGAFSKMLGALIPESIGSGAEVGDDGPGGGGGGGGGASGGPGISILRHELDIVDGRRAARVVFRTTGESASGKVRLQAVAQVLVLEGRAKEGEPPLGADAPQVIGWRDPAGRRFGAGEDTVEIKPGKGEWSLELRLPSNAMVTASLRVR
jgi:hypothetical protein